MGATGAACFGDPGDNPVVGVCVATCEETCDCPAPPAGFEAQLECSDQFTLPGNECIITCADGQACPDGMSCFSGSFCVHGSLPELDVYGDCANLPGSCPVEMDGGAGICLTGVPEAEDMSTGAGAVCSTADCTDADDCPDAPATGSAAVACDPLTDGMNSNCYLNCAAGDCPDGMVCHPDLDICYWETAFLDPYAECQGDDVVGSCPAGPAGEADNCLFTPTVSFCTNACTEAADCLEPGSGDAPTDCIDIAMGMYCILDCADGQTCPDGMMCDGALDICVNMIP
jgi:hypothetical protein